MDNNTIAQRLVSISAQIGSAIAAKQIAAAKQAKPAVVVNARTIRRR